VKVELTKKMKKVLEDLEARQHLQQALAEGGEREIPVGSHRYKLVPVREMSVHPNSQTL
jgi:hypothetical protein